MKYRPSLVVPAGLQQLFVGHLAADQQRTCSAPAHASSRSCCEQQTSILYVQQIIHLDTTVSTPPSRGVKDMLLDGLCGNHPFHMETSKETPW